MKTKLFNEFVENKKSTKKWLFFPVSLIAHGLVFGAVLIVPLMNADGHLPPVKFNQMVMIAPPTAPPPPPAPPKSKTSSKGRKKKPDQNTSKPIPSGRFVAPVEVPSEIPDEDISAFGFDEGSAFGVEGGVEGGVPGGIVGGVLGSETSADQQEIQISTVQKPKLLRKVQPQYPPMALRARLEGMVIVEAVTDIYGRVVKTRIVSGHALLRGAAAQAVKQWVYEPYILNGVPKPVRFTVVVKFNLQGQ